MKYVLGKTRQSLSAGLWVWMPWNALVLSERWREYRSGLVSLETDWTQGKMATLGSSVLPLAPYLKFHHSPSSSGPTSSWKTSLIITEEWKLHPRYSQSAWEKQHTRDCILHCAAPPVRPSAPGLLDKCNDLVCVLERAGIKGFYSIAQAMTLRDLD
jgi:hypothetical protein